ncbi:Sua5/YciO/YrdC/YwlC family protein [Planctobacterium marinum]|uniref:Sua5/YciO/YrdC/YwlC family protein n=1 Tax=Planctobacterium marinum TaxID=1631968 RepID=UPI001E5ABE78|nr:Sua5/YciO/YrdC/YwlC family protein [Planctobacterium marinum]MCC2607238.1 Sua5/YciO/YrdC/YwlC family protein [Planctobacterium marinum]
MSHLSASNEQVDPLLDAFKSGRVFVYPTEAVMGIGCDPDNEAAVKHICQLKNRPLHKGVILIADNYSQLLKYVDDQAIPMDKRTEIFSSWPGANTWLLPKSKTAPEWLTGEHDSIAVRVTAHQGVKALCQRLNSALVSTSANLAGEDPCRTIEEAKAVFGDSVIFIEGETDGNASPSVIRDGVTGQIIRG